MIDVLIQHKEWVLIGVGLLCLIIGADYFFLSKFHD
jgi:hypothetical protein